jgi:hypothetical protein
MALAQFPICLAGRFECALGSHGDEAVEGAVIAFYAVETVLRQL